jgi:hypothetical protein
MTGSWTRGILNSIPEYKSVWLIVIGCEMAQVAKSIAVTRRHAVFKLFIFL